MSKKYWCKNYPYSHWRRIFKLLPQVIYPDDVGATMHVNIFMFQASERRPGQSSEDRSTGSTEDKVHRRLHTVDTEQSKPQPQGSEVSLNRVKKLSGKSKHCQGSEVNLNMFTEL